MRAIKLTEISNTDINDIKIHIFGNHLCFTPFYGNGLLKGDNYNYFEEDKGFYWQSPVYCIDEIDDFIDLVVNSYTSSMAAKSNKFNQLNKSDLKINLLEIFNMNRQMCVDEENLEVDFSDVNNEFLYLIDNFLRLADIPHSLVRILFFDKEFGIRERVFLNMTTDNAVFFAQYELEAAFYEILSNKSSHFNQWYEQPYCRLLDHSNAQSIFLTRLKCLAYRNNQPL